MVEDRKSDDELATKSLKDETQEEDLPLNQAQYDDSPKQIINKLNERDFWMLGNTTDSIEVMPSISTDNFSLGSAFIALD